MALGHQSSGHYTLSAGKLTSEKRYTGTLAIRECRALSEFKVAS